MSKFIRPNELPGSRQAAVLYLLILLILSFFALNAEPSQDLADLHFNLKRTISLAQSEIHINHRTDLLCDFEGNLFLVLTDDNKIVKLSPDGKLLAEIGGFGFGVRQFNRPLALSSRDGGLNLYLLDADNRRIVRLSNTLKWIDQIEIKTEAAGKIMGDPDGLAINSSDEIFISDPRNQRIVKYDRNGKYLDELIGKRRPLLPGMLAIDEHDYLYVCGTGADEVIIFDDLGNLSSRQKPDSIKSVASIKVDRSFRYILDQSSNKIAIFDQVFRLIALIKKGTSEITESFSPVAIAPGPNGRLWIADFDQNRILAYDPARK